MRIWLDDLREPPGGPSAWDAVCRTAKEAIDLIQSGKVTFVDFDHDLGTEKTGYDVALVIEKMAHQGQIPPINYNVHSANPVGAQRIKAAMDTALRFWGKAETVAAVTKSESAIRTRGAPSRMTGKEADNHIQQAAFESFSGHRQSEGAHTGKLILIIKKIKEFSPGYDAVEKNRLYNGFFEFDWDWLGVDPKILPDNIRRDAFTAALSKVKKTFEFRAEKAVKETVGDADAKTSVDYIRDKNTGKFYIQMSLMIHMPEGVMQAVGDKKVLEDIFEFASEHIDWKIRAELFGELRAGIKRTLESPKVVRSEPGFVRLRGKFEMFGIEDPTKYPDDPVSKKVQRKFGEPDKYPVDQLIEKIEESLDEYFQKVLDKEFSNLKVTSQLEWEDRAGTVRTREALKAHGIDPADIMPHTNKAYVSFRVEPRYPKDPFPFVEASGALATVSALKAPSMEAGEDEPMIPEAVEEAFSIALNKVRGFEVSYRKATVEVVEIDPSPRVESREETKTVISAGFLSRIYGEGDPNSDFIREDIKSRMEDAVESTVKEIFGAEAKFTLAVNHVDNGDILITVTHDAQHKIEDSNLFEVSGIGWIDSLIRRIRPRP